MAILMRNTTLYLRRAVPKRYRGIEPRAEVWLSLRTDSPKLAGDRAVTVWIDMLARWDAIMAGDTSEAEGKYLAALDVAKTHGFRFMPTAAIAALPVGKILDRVEVANARTGEIDPKLIPGILGTAKKPEITLSRALDIYWEVAAEKADGKSMDQVRRWKNPRIKAFKNLIDVIGDVPLSEIDADRFLDFRDWWRRKLATKGLTRNSANKDFTHICSTLKEVVTMKRLGLTLPFDSLKAFSESAEKGIRLPFSETWIRDKLLAPRALDGLNLEARCLLLGIINTGYRPSEAQDLLPPHIRLDADVPHISIEPVNRTLKNDTSKRIIPLVGVSLEAFRACPGGFPRYAGKAGLSGTVNKFLRENGLAETPEHTFYGLRHSFEDRLLDRDVDERIRRDLMGHALGRQRYGKGASLEKLAAQIQLIAF